MQLCSCAPAQSAPTIRPYFPSARGACPRVASLACRDRPFRLSNIRADQNLFDLIPQAAAFLSLQKANDLFAILRR